MTASSTRRGSGARPSKIFHRFTARPSRPDASAKAMNSGKPIWLPSDNVADIDARLSCTAAATCGSAAIASDSALMSRFPPVPPNPTS